MIQSLLAAVWRAVPAPLRRAGIHALEAKFTVTAAAVVADVEGRVLLLEHAFRSGAGWGIPGGFVGRGEQPEEALRRELREEVGLELDDVRLLYARTVPDGSQVQLIYRATAKGEPRPRTVEVRSAKWTRADDLPPELTASQRGIIERALAGSD